MTCVVNTMKNCKVHLSAEGESLPNVSAKRRFFSRRLFPLLIVIGMIPLNHKKLNISFKHKGKVNYFMYTDSMIFFANNNKELKMLISKLKKLQDDIRMEIHKGKPVTIKGSDISYN